MKIFYLLLALIVMFATIRSVAADEDKPAEPGKKVPPDEIVHGNGDDVLEEIQGGNKDLFIIIFYVEESKAADVESEIATNITGGDYPWARVTKVDLTKVQDYYNLFSVVGLQGEPKRGHTEPQVLVMKQGEGFIIRGPKIIDGIVKRISRVQDGSIFGSGANTISFNS